MRPPSREQIVARFENSGFDASTMQYLRFHARRYEFLLAVVESAMPPQLHEGARKRRILDIGASFQTVLLRDAYPDADVDTLGFEDPRWLNPGDTHILFDLNDAVSRQKWPVVREPYDVVVMTEVIEHVHSSARTVLEFVASLLRPGGTLVLQTPNAVSLYVRAKTLLGHNPHHMIREDPTDPGHFCEFTVADLRTAVQAAGFEACQTRLANYFGDPSRSTSRRLYDILCAALPGELADGITLTARKS